MIGTANRWSAVLLASVRAPRRLGSVDVMPRSAGGTTGDVAVATDHGEAA
jgi:hypothetical protein